MLFVSAVEVVAVAGLIMGLTFLVMVVVEAL